LKLKILYLFPHHLNIYGDRGNILTLLFRAKKRGIEAEVVEINSRKDLIPDDVNLIFGGGGQDKQQEYVSEELQFFKEELHDLIFEKNVPTLTICGTYQLFGHYFKTFDGNEIKGISVFDMVTVASTKRKIGNVVIKLNERMNADFKSDELIYTDMMVGFENHSGNTFLSSVIPANAGILNQKDKIPDQVRNDKERMKIQSLGRVLKGFGNNGEDGQEGAIVANCIGTYMHGPILPKNPALADWLILKALNVGNAYMRSLQKLNDSLENQTREKVIGRILK
jgi:lipid II isoglutaminyl synthase (glutamine-hydrolysing)